MACLAESKAIRKLRVFGWNDWATFPVTFEIACRWCSCKLSIMAIIMRGEKTILQIHSIELSVGLCRQDSLLCTQYKSKLENAPSIGFRNLSLSPDSHIIWLLKGCSLTNITGTYLLLKSAPSAIITNLVTQWCMAATGVLKVWI